MQPRTSRSVGDRMVIRERGADSAFWRRRAPTPAVLLSSLLPRASGEGAESGRVLAYDSGGGLNPPYVGWCVGGTVRSSPRSPPSVDVTASIQPLQGCGFRCPPDPAALRQAQDLPPAIHERLISVKALADRPASGAKPPARVVQRAGRHGQRIPARCSSNGSSVHRHRAARTAQLSIRAGVTLHHLGDAAHDLVRCGRPIY